MAVYVLDHYYLLVTFLITFAIQMTAFVVSFALQFDKITDITGSANFFLLALLTLLFSNTYHARQIVVTVLVLVWAVRLGSFLLFRVLKAGKDGRFDEMRHSFVRFGGFWTIQLLWVWTVSLPVIVLNSPGVSVDGGNPKFGSASDIAGVIMWAIGFMIESLADAQKTTFKSNSRSKSDINSKGVWGYSRHPNFFGEILLWWGIWTIAIRPATAGVLSKSSHRALWASIAGPIFTTVILLFVSGLPTSEKPVQKRYFLLSHGEDVKDPSAWASYQGYLDSTSILVPLPPSLYRPLPIFIKQTVLLDVPMFNLSPSEQQKAAKEADQKHREPA